MVERMKIESLTLVCDGPLQILYLSQVPEAGGKSAGKVTKG
jgi:hypothetical protein